MKYEFTNFSLRVVDHPRRLEKLGLQGSFTNFFIQQIHATMRMTMMTVTMLLGCLWFHVLFLPKYASVLKLGKALGSTLLFPALALYVYFVLHLAGKVGINGPGEDK